MTQTGLGDAIGLTFQQIQKYERGTNRISSGRLYELARVLDVPVAYFFQNLEAGPIKKDRSGRRSSRRTPPMSLMNRETANLIRAYYKIRSARVRSSVLRVFAALAKS